MSRILFFSTIDNVAPAITITPSDGATGVAIDANITIAFSEPIRKIDDSDLTDTNVDALITLKETNADGGDIFFDATIVATPFPLTNQTNLRTAPYRLLRWAKKGR